MSGSTTGSRTAQRQTRLVICLDVAFHVVHARLQASKRNSSLLQTLPALPALPPAGHAAKASSSMCAPMIVKADGLFGLNHKSLLIIMLVASVQLC
jgi:hypothetical protein